MNFFSKNEIISFFNLEKNELDDFIKDGIPHYKIGNSIRFCINEVSSFLTQRNNLEIDSEFENYLKLNSLSSNDFWDENAILSCFNISIESLALACYNGFEFLSFGNKKYFKKDSFLNFVKISNEINDTVNSENIKTPAKEHSVAKHLVISRGKENLLPKKLYNVNNITFPCLVTDASLSLDINEYRGGITFLETKDKKSHFSFRGHIDGGTSTIVELFVIVRALRFFKDENISKGTLLTDQKGFIQFWNTDDETYLNKKKFPSHVYPILDEVCELKKILKSKIKTFYIGDNSKNKYDEIFFKSYQNSHKICQPNILSCDFENCPFDLSKYSYREDFISLKDLNSKIDAFDPPVEMPINNALNLDCDFLIRYMPTTDSLSFSTEILNFKNKKRTLYKLTSSPSKLHALFISCTNVSKNNSESKIFVFLSKKIKNELDILLAKKSNQIKKSDSVAIKHYKNLLLNPNITFVDSITFNELKRFFDTKKEVI